MVNFSDLDDDSYQLRNFFASSRKEMLPGCVLAFPPRPQITSTGEGVDIILLVMAAEVLLLLDLGESNDDGGIEE